MAARGLEAYRVVTYVDRTESGQLRAEPVREARCADEAGAMFHAIKSLVVASTQPGLYWSEWSPGNPTNPDSGAPGEGRPDRALLRANGEIVLDLAALRGQPGLTHAPDLPPAIVR